MFEIKLFKEMIKFSFCHAERCVLCKTMLIVMPTRLFLSLLTYFYSQLLLIVCELIFFLMMQLFCPGLPQC